MVYRRYKAWMHRLYGSDPAVLLNAHHGVFKALAGALMLPPILVFAHLFLRETPAYILLVCTTCALGLCSTVSLLAVLLGRLRLADHIFIASVSIVTLVVIYFTGGLPHSELSMTLVILPMGIFQLYGTRLGVFASIGFAAAAIIAFISSTAFGVQPPNLFASLDNAILKPAIFSTIYISILALFVGEHMRATKLQSMMSHETQKFADLAARDGLTHLANARCFYDRMEATLAKQDEPDFEGFSLVFIDLNDFKIINDRYGHHIGDQVLQLVSRRIEKCIRNHDLAARIGGDEFAILLFNKLSRLERDRIVSRIMTSIRKPMVIEHKNLHVSASLGLVACPQDGQSREALMQTADARMYAHKNTLKIDDTGAKLKAAV